MEFNSFTAHKDFLPNGLKVITVETPYLHTMEVMFYIKVGSRYETPELNGISHFLEHILFKGTKNYPTPHAFLREIENCGGSVNASTGRDYSSYYLSVHPKYLERTLRVFSDIFKNPLMRGIETEREVVIEELLEDKNMQGAEISLDTLSRRMLWPDHPLGFSVIGSESNIRQFRAEDLFRHFQKYYVARNMVLCLAGPIKRAEALRIARELVSDLPEGQYQQEPPVSHNQLGPAIKIVEHQDSQTQIGMSFRAIPATDPDFHALSLIRMMLSDGMSSRLYYRICETLGLAYDIQASLEGFADAGVLDIDVAVSSEKIIRIIKEVFAILQTLKKEEVAESELAMVKDRYGMQMEGGLDNSSALAAWFGATELFFPPDSFEARWQRIKAITPADIRRVANFVFQPSGLNLVLVGPLEEKFLSKVSKLCSILEPV
jgi:predicted Zn-dependent peptidase